MGGAFPPFYQSFFVFFKARSWCTSCWLVPRGNRGEPLDPRFFCSFPRFFSRHFCRTFFSAMWGEHTSLSIFVVLDRTCCTQTCYSPTFPRQSLRRGRQKSIPPQGSVFQKWRSCPDTLLNEFTRSNTLMWFNRIVGRDVVSKPVWGYSFWKVCFSFIRWQRILVRVQIL